MRLLDIDRARGLGIILVVFGHLVARDLSPAGNAWYAQWNAFLYSFHMAFFFYLSGLVFFLKPAPLPMPMADYRRFVASKARRLLPAYAVFAIIVMLGKWGFAQFLHVDRAVGPDLSEVVKLATLPTESYASFLWFIVALFGVYALVPWLIRASAGHIGLACLLALGLHLLPAPKWFALHQVCRYTLFFMVAAIAVSRWEQYLALLDRHGWVCVLVFALVGWVTPPDWRPLFVALAALPALHVLARQAGGWPGDALEWLGRYSFPIYLMNSMAIGLTKGVLLKAWSWDGPHFLVYIPLLLTAGLLLPVLLKQQVIARLPWLDRITN